MTDHERGATPRSDDDRQPARPTDYSKEIAEIICDRIVEDETLGSICGDIAMPDMRTLASWLTNNIEFREMYAFAREFQAHCILDETIELVDEVSTELVEKVRANGRVAWAADRTSRLRYRLRIEVRNFVGDALLARARQLSARTLFQFLDPHGVRNAPTSRP